MVQRWGGVEEWRVGKSPEAEDKKKEEEKESMEDGDEKGKQKKKKKKRKKKKQKSDCSRNEGRTFIHFCAPLD